MIPREIYYALITYLEAKVYQRDWHGVADAANDLRELEAKHPDLKEIA